MPQFFFFLLSQFCHLVTAVERLADAWRVSFEDLTTKTSVVAAARYDAVIVCNGHNSMPNMPVIPAMDRYAGVVIHSHDYRAPERFRDADVLVVGAGPSGIDICWDVAGVASRVSATVSGRPSELSIESVSVAGIFQSSQPEVVGPDVSKQRGTQTRRRMFFGKVGLL